MEDIVPSVLRIWESEFTTNLAEQPFECFRVRELIQCNLSLCVLLNENAIEFVFGTRWPDDF